jgi:glycosyltransferase involved in cell wall biosynthesis
MTLKICHLISGDLWAGAEVMAFHLLGGLSAQPKIDLFVILLNNGRLAVELKNSGISTLVLDENKRSFPEILRLAAKEVRKRTPHILHSHRYKENILSYLVSITLGERAALISTQHGMPELYDAHPNLLQRIKLYANYRLLASRFDKTIAVSSDIRESLERDYGIQEKRLETIRNGINVPEVRDCFMARDEFVIGSAGRFVPVKDYLFMVEVAKEVAAKTDKIRFELAGEGPMLNEIQGLINKYGLEKRFTLRGFIRDVDSFYPGLDVYLNTSLHEGIPMSVLEAMAYGVPPIAPRVGGLGEIVTNGVDGYLVDARDPGDYAERCVSLYSNEALRRNMARAAREKIIGQFSIDRMVNAYLDMYRRTIEGSGRGLRQ